MRGTTTIRTYVSAFQTFQSTCPLRGTTTPKYFALGYKTFQSTCPLRGTTLVVGHAIHAGIISIHVPLAGHDDVDFGAHVVRIHFNPRAPCGARPQPSSRPFSGRISIHVPLAGHDDLGHRHSGHIAISIHVPLAGHDGDYALFAGGNIISIHVPLAGHDDESQWQVLIDLISIHVPLAGHDDIYTLGRDAATGFQSTCPLRGTTFWRLFWDLRFFLHFNPRAPCGARLKRLRGYSPGLEFQSTCPLRGTTWLFLWPQYSS